MDLNQYLLQRLDKIQEDIGHIRDSQGRTEGDLKYHIRRTDLLEDMQKEMRKRVDVMWAPLDLISRVLRWLKLLR